ncbi:calcitonin gene-related peptide type 1 receptor-like isoform X2 [Babylonia areolata]|uniref:calcitonin gene-related peptide type 1 receptor-like isoform X2 n=1 Tax=Babylonia areolata TaxID=304850 RepID=UPI003FD2F80A
MELVCRDRFGVFNTTFFKLWTCSMCYTYLFQDSSPAFTLLPNDHRLVALPSSASSSSLPPGLTLAANVDDPEVVQWVCSTLDGAGCGRWKDCCRAAEACCREQQQTGGGLNPAFIYDPYPAVPGGVGVAGSSSTTARDEDDGDGENGGFYRQVLASRSVATSSGGGGSSGGVETTGEEVRGEEGGGVGRVVRQCPRTWDGFGCFKDTAAGLTASIGCPSYILHSNPSALAYKQCTENGTWWRNSATLQEWTDYTGCVHMEAFRTLYYVSVTCNVFSLLLLLPACLVFLSYRKLREQQRIQIHVHLFLSFVLTSVVMVLWENLVYSDRLHNPAQQSLMYKDSWGCKFLYVLTRYAWTCNFCWMFLEGFHLHRLIVKAFEVPRSILGYYLVGWGGSWIPVIVYAIIRAVRKDSGCWVHNIEGFEWIIYTPNVLCIAVNVFFLFSILRILLTQLTTHPNEPSNYRRALRATSVLVPLFGLQLFLVIYRPQASPQVTHVYDIIGALVTNSQGGLVALIFCFFNKEVLSHLKQLKVRCSRCLSRDPYDTKGLSSHTYVLTERVGQGQGHNGPLSRSPGSMRGQYVSVTTQERGSHGSAQQRGTAENFV